MTTRNFTRRSQQHDAKRQSRRRRATFKRLEDRRVMAVDFAWAFTLGSAGSDSARDVAVDPAGNVGIVGTFTGTVDFDPGPGVYNLTTVPANGQNNYVAKYDPDGKLLSAQQFAGVATPWNNRSIAFDASGNMVIAGTFTGAVEFGATTLTSQGLEDVFVAKFDAIGNIVWARRFGSVQADGSGGLAVDGEGNVVVGVNSSSDALIVSLDSSGNELWAWRVGVSTSPGRKNASNGVSVSSITVDGAGSVFATGGFSGTVDFDPGPAVATLSSPPTGAFVVKLASSGNISWARGFAASNFGEVYAAGIGVSSDGAVYSAGRYYDSVDFDPGTLKSQKYILNSGGRNVGAGYVSALDANGNFLWAKSTRSVSGGHVITFDLALDAANNVYISGDFSGAVDFDPEAGETTLTATNSFITFVWQLDANGGFEWAGAMGTQGDHYGFAIDVDSNGNIYTAGRWAGSGDFDPGAGTNNLTSSAYDGYLIKLTQMNSLSLATSSAISNSVNQLAVSSDRVAVGATKTRRVRDDARPLQRSDWTVSIDAAIEELDDEAWPELAVDF
jgi:hypothetical protein